MFNSRWIITWVTVFMAGCATVPPPAAITREELVRRDNALGVGLAPDLEKKLTLRGDIEVAVYLRKLAERMTLATHELATSPVGVFLAADRTEKWKSYGLPGNRIYLSIGLVRNLAFENELAAVIAIELAHILERHVAGRLPGAKDRAISPLSPAEASDPETSPPAYSTDGATLPTRIDYFGPSGIFAFSEEESLRAIEVAVSILYSAGIDSRGLVAYWQHLQKNPSRSPYYREALAKFIEKTRQTIALYAPLRNPIVRSDAFLTIRKRIRTL